MGSWEEALDIDDSDLPSLIRPSLSQALLPCKRSHLSTTLKPCSQPPQPQPQTLDPQSQQSPNPKHSAPSAFKPHPIPGPAGLIQAAMHRKTLSDQSNKDNISSTQEFITRAMQDDGIDPDDDDDFKQNPWLCAIGINSQLGSIKNCRYTHRLPEAVGIVKSCSPNGLGDLIVTLKDTTGTVGANIHRKVLTESEFGKDISVGSVLILRNVAVFSPSPSAQYLNITLKNVSKVISKDSGPPSSNRHPAFPVRAAAASVTAERFTDEDIRGYTNKKDLADRERRANEHNLVERTFSNTSGSSTCQQAVMEVEPLVRQDEAMEGTTELSKGDDSDKENIVSNNESQVEGSWNFSRKVSQHASSAPKSIGNNRDGGGIGRSGSMTQRPQLISSTTLPQWTDEQLAELFAASDDW